MIIKVFVKHTIVSIETVLRAYLQQCNNRPHTHTHAHTHTFARAGLYSWWDTKIQEQSRSLVDTDCDVSFPLRHVDKVN